MSKSICKLCLEHKQLQDSHLIPRSLYKKARNPHLKNPHPFVQTAKGFRQNSLQVSDYVLCSDCEQRFSKYGEDYMMRMVVQANGCFPLLEQLLAKKTGTIGPGMVAYSIKDAPEIDRDKIAYFAASVFWRAAVHTWRLEGVEDGKFVNIRLARYAEDFRKYLLSQAPFPEHAYLLTVVCSDVESHPIFFMPVSDIKSRDKVHIVMVRGLTFFLGVGREVPERIRKYCLVHSQQRWIHVRSCSDPPIYHV